MNSTKSNRTKPSSKNNITRKKRIFKKKDFISGDGMLTSVWGPSMWHFLHTMSFNYPVNPTEDDKKNYMNFILMLEKVLPCKYCRMNLKNNFKQKPIQMCHMANRETFSRYIYELHELVNKMLKKTSKLSYCDVRERYEHFRSRCTEEKPKVFTFKKTSTTPINKNKKNTTKKERGCTEPLYGKKSKCIINIVPQEEKGSSLQIDKKCIKSRDEIKK